MDNSRCILYISAILRMVLDDLADSDDKGSIVSLAYTSKAVSGTALDYLWADMDSLVPFVPLLPSAIRNILWNKWFDPTSLPLIECPPPEKWQLFDTYAHRVRRIHPCGRGRALYNQIASIRTGVDLFPNLSSLQCYLFDPLTPGMKLFPSSLRSLLLHTEYALVYDGRAELALRQAASDAPYLEKLYIIGKYQLYAESGSQPLDFKKLHTVHLHVYMLHPAALKSFSHLLSTSPIRTLGILVRCCETAPFRVDDTIIPHNAFPWLENISIFDSPGRAADIISCIRSPYLKSVTIEHRDRHTSASGYDHFFTLLAKRHQPIYTLEVRTGSSDINAPNKYVRELLTTLELLVHAGLTRLSVEVFLPDPSKIKDDIKGRLRPAAWPSSTEFAFVFTEA